MPQPLSSMTGYARATGAVGDTGFNCEIKSVNGRGLDIRMRLSGGLDPLEAELRRLVGRHIARGSVTLTLYLDREAGSGEVYVNRQALETVLSILDELEGRVDAERPRLEGILSLKGVLEQREPSLAPDAEEALHASMLAAVERCLVDLVDARRREGAALAGVLATRIDEIEALTERAEAHPARYRETVLERLRVQLDALAEAGLGVSEDRLAQEALILATKADIREELDRLRAHIAAARQLIGAGGPVGRKLDFLAQEFNREANTLCAKSNAVELTAIGLDLKAAIDQLREQIQNIE